MCPNGTALLPGILKTARLGYDGKGQIRVATRAELAAAWDALKNVPCVLEKMLPLAAECSVIVARGADGDMVHFHPQLNLHRDGILAVTQVFEGNLPLPSVERRRSCSYQINSKGLQYVGVLCVEFFVLADGSLVVNEMAPRPHNSGHYSWTPATSRSSNCRCARWPACRWCSRASTAPPSCSTCWATCGSTPPAARTPAWSEVLALPGTHLHLYGKPRRARAARWAT
jgi:5-(carboxyamino)imidazole ribonucleotide synthase